jgi:hypothetical protein
MFRRPLHNTAVTRYQAFLRCLLFHSPPPPAVFYAAENMADGLIEVSRLGVLTLGGNATLEATAAYIKQPGQTLTQLQSVPYDQYEVGLGGGGGGAAPPAPAPQFGAAGPFSGRVTVCAFKAASLVAAVVSWVWLLSM